MTPRKRLSLIAKIRCLTPTEFENLSYDLLVLSGLSNAVWRTPGADGGRDIEGNFSATDLSEVVTVERWYIECKHYKSSLDWPTVYGKIAYADNHSADFLLLVTTSTLSPTCKEEVSKREATKARPRVRLWDAAILENMVARHPLLLAKYGLASGRRVNTTVATLPIMLMLSKLVQAAYGRAGLKGSTDAALEFSAALIDLMSARLLSFKEGLTVSRRFLRKRDLYPWCRLGPGDGHLEMFDSYGLRALLAATRFFSSRSEVTIKPSAAGQLQLVVGAGPEWTESKTARDAFALIGSWSNLEVWVRRSHVNVRLREGG